LKIPQGRAPTPPGFVSGLHARGHLLARVFGGEFRLDNFVPLVWQANSTMWFDFELRAVRELTSCNVLEYKVTAKYSDPNFAHHMDTVPVSLDLSYTPSPLGTPYARNPEERVMSGHRGSE
jgi:hypothetical protein